MDIDNKALSILKKYNVINPGETSSEDFIYAKEAGYMFDNTHQTHDEAIDIILSEAMKTNKSRITSQFLSSLSTNRLDWRAGLSVYVIAKSLPKHMFDSGESGSCAICGAKQMEFVDFSFANLIRYALGGIVGGNIYQMAFILQEQNKLPDLKPTRDDFAIFNAMFEVIKNADCNDGPAQVQKGIGRIKGFKSNKEQRKSLLETLGFCSIL